MAEERVQRRLAAILAADVVGYSRLVGMDEVGTLSAFKDHLNHIVEPEIARNRGRIVKTMGDGVLAEFASAVDAVLCARAIQEGMIERNADVAEDRRLRFRIGVNVGDIVIDGDDIQGDGVNIAARLEGIAEPDGICISGTAYDQVHGKLDAAFVDLGEQQVKNIARPIRAYRVTDTGDAANLASRKTASWKRPAIAAGIAALVAVAGGLTWWQPWQPDVEPASLDKMAFKLPDRPSIAVLPFTNMSGDKQQEYFADGLTEDIITSLASFPNLFVIARQSTARFKGKPVDIRDVAHDLGVRYVLEGSVRRAGNTVRITAQLIDALSGNHIWAAKYDRELKDIFALQDEITGAVGSRLVSEVAAVEFLRGTRKGTRNAEAYDLFLRGYNVRLAFNPRDNARAIQLFEQAVEKDPGFARAFAYLAFLRRSNVIFRWAKGPKDTLSHVLELARKAVALDPRDSQTHRILSLVYQSLGQFARSIDAAEKAVSLSPSDPDALIALAHSLAFAGRGDDAVRQAKMAIRLNPHGNWGYPLRLGFAYFMAKRFDKAAEAFERARRLNPRTEVPVNWAAAAYAQLDRMEEARAARDAYMKLRPRFSIRGLMKRMQWKSEFRKLFLDGLRKAGFPESPPLKLPDKPSIAVLPFANLSDDKKQEYFSDGITEDIITDLSKVSGLFVIARNSSFKFKGRSVDVREVARDLGVGHVVKGSVRKSGSRVRITAQLIDARTGNHLWAERYDRELSDIFGVQDDVVGRIVSALAVELTDTDKARRARRHRTINLQAYESVLRGRQLLRRIAGQDTEKARVYFEKAISIDPEYARAYTNLGLLYWNAWRLWGRDRTGNLTRALQIGKKAVAHDPDDAGARTLLAVVHQFRREHDLAEIEANKAIALEPTHAETLGNLGGYLWFAGRPREAIEYLERAVRLDPYHPSVYLTWLGGVYSWSGRYDRAITALKRAIRREPDYIVNHVALAAAYAHSGKDEDARAEAAEILRLNPNFTLRAFKAFVPIRKKADLDHYVTGLRRAGLPD